MLLVINFLNTLTFVLAGCIGLHLPRSFTLLYCFAAVVILLARLRSRSGMFGSSHPQTVLAAISLVALILFSCSYVVGMLWWGFWILPDDFSNILNALTLPGLLFIAGLGAASLGVAWATRVFLCYALGGLIYVLAALVVSRSPWWNVGEIFPLMIDVPWGNAGAMNVRSVEQSAYPSLLLAAPAFTLLASNSSFSRLKLLLFLLVASMVGAHAVWSLNGRLGWLALLIAVLPLSIRAAHPLKRLKAYFFSSGNRLWLLVGMCASAVAVFRIFFPFLKRFDSGIWTQGFCDERLDMFAAMFARMYQAPWGGKLLRIPYEGCGDRVPMLLSQAGGSIVAVHNVPLEIYYSVGSIPLLLLIAAVVPLLVVVLRGFFLALPGWNWHVSLRWSWLVLLFCQWMFQPLLYSDGLLYYFTFFVLGLLVVEASCHFTPVADVGFLRKQLPPGPGLK